MKLVDAAAVFALAVSPDQQSFVFGDRGHVTACGIDGSVLWSFRFPGPAFRAAPISALAFSHDGARVLAGPKSLTLLDATTGKKMATIKAHKRRVLGAKTVDGGFLTWSGEAISPPDNSVRRVADDGSVVEILAKMQYPLVTASFDGHLTAVDKRGNVFVDGETVPLAGLRFAETLAAVAIARDHVFVARGVSVHRYVASTGELVGTVDIGDLDALVARAFPDDGPEPTEESKAQAAKYIMATGCTNALASRSVDQVIVATGDGIVLADFAKGDCSAGLVWSTGRHLGAAGGLRGPGVNLGEHRAR